MLGFIEVVPLALTGIDFVWFIIAIAGYVVLAAGWSIYSPIFDVLNNVSIFGVKPFGFITKLLQASMQKLAAVMLTRLSPVAHWLWALTQMVWRPLYVTLETLTGLVAQMTGISQGAQSGLAQLRAQEQGDIARANTRMDNLYNQAIAAEQAEAATINARIGSVFNQLTVADDQGIAGVNTRIDNVFNQLTAQERADFQANNIRMDNLYNQAIATDQATNAVTNTRIDNVFNQLTNEIKNGVTTAEGFATGLVGGLGVGSILQSVTSLRSDLNAVKTDITECLDPLCDTVTPNAQRAGRNLNWLKNLESLGVEALMIALAAECLTNPGAVANDIHTVVTDVGDPIMTGFKDLIGA